MKKLMTMISAVAVAFGLQAAAPYPSGSHFNQEKWLETESETKMWNDLEGLSISTDPATFLDQVGYPAQFEGEDLLNNLAFQRGLTDPTYRAIQVNEANQPVPQTIGENGVVVDTLIKFTAYDGDDQANIEGTDAKIAVWVKENEGADGAASTYQLMVTAGQYVNETLVRMDYACSSKITDMDAWYRLTVKAIPDVTNGGHIPGFIVFINGEAVTSGEVKATGVPLSTEAAVWNLNGAIFPALLSDDQTLKQVGFAGQGWIDDLSITDAIPDFAKVKETFTITGGDHVESFQYNDQTWNKGDGPMMIILEGAPESVTDIVYDDGYFGDTIATVKREANYANTVGNAKELRATVTIDGQATSFETIAAAVEKVNAANSAVTLKLGADVSGDVGQLSFETTEGATITLDLAGKTVATSIYAMTKVVIIDSDPAGTGKVDGMVEGELGMLEIQGGKYKESKNENLASSATLPAGQTLVPDGNGYLVLGAAVAFSVESADHVEAKILINDLPVEGDIPETLTAGQTYKVTFTAATGYQFAEGEKTVFEGTAAADPIVIKAPAVTAIAYTITYSWTGVEDADAAKIDNKNPETYTIEDTITFTAPTCEGYTFKGFNIQGIAPGSTGNKTVTGTFEKSSMVVDPSKEPVVVDSEEAANALIISATSPNAEVVSNDDYAKYFKKVVTPVEGDKFSVVAVLDETVVKAEEVAAELAGKFDQITDDGVEVAAKPGLFYSVEQGQTLGAMTEGERVMATGAKVQLKATKYSGSGFYKILVNTSAK